MTLSNQANARYKLQIKDLEKRVRELEFEKQTSVGDVENTFNKIFF